MFFPKGVENHWPICLMYPFWVRFLTCFFWDHLCSLLLSCNEVKVLSLRDGK